MNWKKLGKILLFPRTALLPPLVVLSAGCLTAAMLRLDERNPLRYAAYLFAFYALMVCCMRTPDCIRFFRRVKTENRYAKRWLHDTDLRVRVTLSGSAIWNGAYAVLQLCLGVTHRSLWFYSLACYYLLLALLRLYLLRHASRRRNGTAQLSELRCYRSCGWVFLFVNLALTVMIFYMVYRNRVTQHHEITTITMAAYTFTALTMAIVNVVRYRRYNSPVFSASKAVSLAAACVSMLTLEGTMLVTFDREGMSLQTRRLFLGLSGGAVSVFIVSMAIYMIAHGNRTIKRMELEHGAE